MRHRFALLLFVVTGVCLDSCLAASEAVPRAEVVARVGADIQYLSSDELEGRDIGGAGIRKAADRILGEYKRLGLKGGMPDGSFEQPFDVQAGNVKVAESTHLRLVGGEDAKWNLEVGVDFQPLHRGMNGGSKGELLFVGYGITSPEDNYDDYAGIDAEGRILVMIRREPRQGIAGPAFEGTRTTAHSYIDTKLSLAQKHKAAGVIFVNDPFSVPGADTDELTSPAGFGIQASGIPFVHVKQAVIDRMLAQAPLVDADSRELKSLAEVTDRIDNTLQPLTQPLRGWSASMNTEFIANSITAYNLVGVVEGEGPLADQTIIIGGHYDHLGLGGFGSRAPNRKGEIHNGADDNATGTAAVVEMARRISAGPKPKRRMVFICFSGEERGLIGSNFYVRNPLFPIESTVAMLNFDMIGTLSNNRVEVNGVGTAKEFRAIAEAADAALPITTRMIDSPFAGSDHLPFFRMNIPVMFCFTGTTNRYHTPDDDFDTINVEGVVSVIDYSELLLHGIDDLDQPPAFQQMTRRNRRRSPVLGIRPALGNDDDSGVIVQGVSANRPAEKAGIQVGDVIVGMNGSKIKSYPDLISFLGGTRGGAKVTVRLMREGKELDIEVTLSDP